MNSPTQKPLHLPWNQHDHYWIHIGAQQGSLSPALMQTMKTAGMEIAGPYMVVSTGREWKPVWDKICAQLIAGKLLESVKVAVTSGKTPPAEATLLWREAAMVQTIADSLWLGEALLEDRILCYLQPVVSARDKTFGYESFVRAQAKDGSVIGGDQVMVAGRALGIEYMIDRHLHVQAITTFVCSDFDGFLFVNLFPGFIQRPSVYLEGLSDAAKSFGIVSKHVVLDFTRSESPRDIAHIKSICEYGKSRGYSIALDDIESFDGAKKLVPDIKPDFVKLDSKLVAAVEKPSKRTAITRIVELVHSHGGMVIAEGVENEKVYKTLKNMNIDLFQGYYFSPPVPVETVVVAGSRARAGH